MEEKRNIKQVFGDNVRKYRLLKDWTQMHLGIEVNLEATSISKIELGKANPSLSKIGLLAKALGCEPADLLKY